MERDLRGIDNYVGGRGKQRIAWYYYCCKPVAAIVYDSRNTDNGYAGRLAHLLAAAASFRPSLRAACFREELCARAPVSLFARASLPSLQVFPVEQQWLCYLARPQELL